MKFWYPFALLLLNLLFAFSARAAEPTLALDAYLSDVKSNNLEIRSALQASEGARLRSAEKELITGFNFFADGQYQSDAKLPVTPLFTYDKIITQNYNLGISKLTTFGSNVKLYYNLMHIDYINPVIPGAPPPFTGFYDTKPVLEVSQSLWSNGFGRGTRANVEAAEASAMAVSYANSFKARVALIQAEQAYWQLSFARERVAIAKTALEQSQKIHEWASGRAKSNLGDQADALQAKAALELRELEVQAAVDDERAARRAFNNARNREDDQVPERLTDVNVDALVSSISHDRPAKRDDVKAAEEQQKAAIAASQAAMEKDRPTLDVYGSLAYNGRGLYTDDAFGAPFTQNRPTYAVGVKFVLPLNRGAASDAVTGHIQEQKAAEISYQQKLQDQEWTWRDLNRKLEEVTRRLKLSRQIVAAQKAKLEHERTRLRQGRTTTFQVLQFETEYAQSQLALLKAEADVVAVTTQMKLYGGSL